MSCTDANRSLLSGSSRTGFPPAAQPQVSVVVKTDGPQISLNEFTCQSDGVVDDSHQAILSECRRRRKPDAHVLVLGV